MTRKNPLHLLRHQSKMFLPFSVALRAFSALSVFRFGFSVLNQS